VLRLTAALAAAVAAAALAAAAAPAQSLPETLPSFTERNAPGSIVVPIDLSVAPAGPERRTYEQLLGLWQRAGAAYGIPWQILGAINKIESNFGQGMGPSSAGAVGWMQFLPSTWMDWGMDGSGDGIADPWNPEDAVYAAARYLAAAGAHEDMYRAIFAYNHADWYVRNVLELASGGQIGDDVDPWLRSAIAPGGFALPRFFAPDLGQLLAQARADLRRARRFASGARHRADRLGWRILDAQQRAGDPELSLPEFRALEAWISELESRRELAESTLAVREDELLQAEARVDDLVAQESTVAFALSNTVALPGVTAPGARAALSWAVSHVGLLGYSQGPTTDRGGDVLAMQSYEPAGPTCDCSMFTRWAMAQTGLDVGLTTVQQWPANGLLPDDETPAETLAVSRGVGSAPPLGGYVPGDLIFWGHAGGNAGHVALYLGSGLIVQCSGDVGSNIRPLAGYGTPTGWVRWHAVTGTAPTTFDVVSVDSSARQVASVAAAPVQTGRVFTVVGNRVVTFTR
jgi:cell wall-associated NlpC family hydrolase